MLKPGRWFWFVGRSVPHPRRIVQMVKLQVADWAEVMAAPRTAELGQQSTQ